MFFGHKHDWQPRAVTQDRYGGWNMAGSTTVLSACSRCGRTEVRKMHGLWEIEDLVVVSDQKIASFLKKENNV